MAICEMLKVNTTLTSIKCAHKSSTQNWPKILSVATDKVEISILIEASIHGSLGHSDICKGGKMEGLMAICEMLKVNTTLTAIKCAQTSNLAPKIGPNFVSSRGQNRPMAV